jgi:hypothetical protein
VRRGEASGKADQTCRDLSSLTPVRGPRSSNHSMTWGGGPVSACQPDGLRSAGKRPSALVSTGAVHRMTRCRAEALFPGLEDFVGQAPMPPRESGRKMSGSATKPSSGYRGLAQGRGPSAPIRIQTPEQTFSTHAPSSRGGSAGPRDSTGVSRGHRRTTTTPRSPQRLALRSVQWRFRIVVWAARPYRRTSCPIARLGRSHRSGDEEWP